MNDRPPAQQPVPNFERNRSTKSIGNLIEGFVPEIPELERLILGKMGCLECLTHEGLLVSTGEATVGPVLTEIRAADPMARITVITNEGNNYVDLYEDGHHVWRLEAGETHIMPVSGRLKLEGVSVNGSPMIVTITTLRRDFCCGEEYGQDLIPIGAELI